MTTSLPLIEIYSVGSCDSVTRKGSYEACIQDGDARSYYTGTLTDTTANRCIIQGMIDLVERVKKPSQIKLISSTSVGARKQTGPNADLTAKLKSLIEAGRHTAQFSVVSGKSNDIRSFIRAGSRGDAPEPKQAVLSKESALETRDWFAYMLPPIDFGWENLSTVDEVHRMIKASEAEAIEEATRAGLEFDQDDLPYSSHKFDSEWLLAQEMAKELGMSSDHREDPATLWLPGLMKFSHAFVFKECSNGTTYVISPVAMPWLDEISMTRNIQAPKKTSRFDGTPRQIKWVEAIVAEALAKYAQIAELAPQLAGAMAGLRLLLEAQTDRGWIIAKRNDLGFITYKNGGQLKIRKESIVNHPLLQQYAVKVRDEFQPLMEMCES